MPQQPPAAYAGDHLVRAQAVLNAWYAKFAPAGKEASWSGSLGTRGDRTCVVDACLYDLAGQFRNRNRYWGTCLNALRNGRRKKWRAPWKDASCTSDGTHFRRRKVGQMYPYRRIFIAGFYGASEIFLTPSKTTV